MKYCVIGGQYELHYYGSTETLLAAKQLATKNSEYWDNWQGWNKPQIYRIEDTEEIETKGMITYDDGHRIRSPKMNAEPVCYWDRDKKRWIENCDVK